MKRPTVISAFAGYGGSTLGYMWAGYKELLAIDFDKGATEVFRLNFDIPVWTRDICGVTAEEVLRFCGIARGELGVLDGSPPCQGFSTLGKRIVSDERNDLFKEFVRLICGIRPRVFIMENVSGMAKGIMRGRFIEVMKGLKGTGYNVKCKLMNSMYYGVPQARERLIFIGVRADTGREPSFPPGTGRLETVMGTLRRLGCDIGECWTPPGKNTATHRLIMRLRQGESGAKYHPKGHRFNLCRLKANAPSRTLTASAGSAIIHPFENRFISDKEALVLSSFPADFKLAGGVLARIGGIGNAVMPRFMQAIAEHVKRELL